MTKDIHKKALEKLKTINKLTLRGPAKRIKVSGKDETYRTEIKHQLIPLDEYTLIVSGVVENSYSMNHSLQNTFLTIALFNHDSPETQVRMTSEENYQFKEVLKNLIG